MTDKRIIKKLAKRYKEMCNSPFADGYTFKAFEGRCAEQGFTIDDVRNYIEKEKQGVVVSNKMDKPKRYCEGIDCAWCNEKEPCIYKIANELEEKLLRKEKECEKLEQALTEIKDIAEKQCNICEALTPIDEYKDCKKCWQGKILQKISECGVYKV